MKKNNLIIAGSLFVTCVTGHARAVQKCDVLPKPKNVIDVPSYASPHECPEVKPPEEKYQYKGNSDVKPHFEEKVSPEAQENGAVYREGTELYVGPDSDFNKTNEPITESQDELPEIVTR